MKLLEIKENKGYFLKADSEFEAIDKIAKEDILKLVNLTLNDEVEFDEYDEEKIKNQAHQIIYKNIYSKLKSLEGRKQEFLDESQRLFLQDYEKYKADISSEETDSE